VFYGEIAGRHHQRADPPRHHHHHLHAPFAGELDVATHVGLGASAHLGGVARQVIVAGRIADGRDLEALAGKDVRHLAPLIGRNLGKPEMRRGDEDREAAEAEAGLEVPHGAERVQAEHIGRGERADREPRHRFASPSARPPARAVAGPAPIRRRGGD